MNNKQIEKGKELIIYSESPQTQNNTDNTYTAKINNKIKELLTKLEVQAQKLVNHRYYQKVTELTKKYGKYAIIIILLLLVIGLIFFPHRLGFLIRLLAKFKIVFLTLLWACLGMLTGGVISTLVESKGQVVLDNTQAFLDYCLKSNGLVFFGSIGSGKTAILAMLGYHSPVENKYASFPCGLPWMKRYHISFDVAPDKPLGVKEDIFIDETNLLFRGNIVTDVREHQRFVMRFMELSRHQGTRVFVNGQRLGHFSVEQREVTTGVCEVSLLQKTDSGIYVQCEIWQSRAWTNQKTETNFTIFIPIKYLETYDSYWLKSLKYLRKFQNYI